MKGVVIPLSIRIAPLVTIEESARLLTQAMWIRCTLRSKITFFDNTLGHPSCDVESNSLKD